MNLFRLGWSGKSEVYDSVEADCPDALLERCKEVVQSVQAHSQPGAKSATLGGEIWLAVGGRHVQKTPPDSSSLIQQAEEIFLVSFPATQTFDGETAARNLFSQSAWQTWNRRLDAPLSLDAVMKALAEVRPQISPTPEPRLEPKQATNLAPLGLIILIILGGMIFWLWTDRSALRWKVEEQREEVVRLKEEKERVKTERESSNSALQSQKSKMEKDLDEAKLKNATLEKENTKLRRLIDELENKPEADQSLQSFLSNIFSFLF